MAFAPTQLRSGRWQGGFRHPVTRKKVTRTFDYAYEAEAWAVVEEERARPGAQPTLSPDPAQPAQQALARWVGPTVGEYGRKYLGRRAGSIERATRDKYGAWLTGLGLRLNPERPPLAEVPMGLLTKAEVEQWLTDSRDAEVGRPTINGRLRLLRMLYADLLDSDDPPEGLRNPTRGLRFLAEEYNSDRILTEGEDDELLAAMAEIDLHQLRIACIVALDAGLRWQETYALRAESVSGHYLVISHVIERGSRELRGFTKGKRTRVVPMTERLERELAPWVADARKTPSGLLFPSYSRGNRKSGRSEVWDYANFRKRQWLPALLEVGAAKETFTDTGRISQRDGTPILQRRLVEPAYGFHALRHTYGSRLAADGLARHEIAELMGHVDERVTARYIHAGDDGRRLQLIRNIERLRAA